MPGNVNLSLMSRGLGHLQRWMLRQMALQEVRRAETAAQEQRPQPPPFAWSLSGLCRSLASDGPLTAKFQARIQATHDGWKSLSRDEIDAMNPTRAMNGLVARGLVHKREYRRHRALSLTAAGFAEARRLAGDGLASDVVDLNTMQEHWGAAPLPWSADPEAVEQLLRASQA